MSLSIILYNDSYIIRIIRMIAAIVISRLIFVKKKYIRKNDDNDVTQYEITR